MKKFSKGITLVEVMVVISIIAVITGVMVSDFPRIKLQLSLGRAVHMLSQDIKTAQDLANAGAQQLTQNGNFITPKGYGIYIDNSIPNNTEYIIYADVDGNGQYSSMDIAHKEVDLSKTEPGIIIEGIRYGTSVLSINFAPPNFVTTITSLLEGQDGVEIIIAIKSIPDVTRTIYVNKAGFIETR
jgi:prepilin-type N-terminal cleavage/methylation domain-containing protein